MTSKHEKGRPESQKKRTFCDGLLTLQLKVAMLNSTLGGRFPPAWLEPPRSRNTFALRGLMAYAIPQESPASSSINENPFLYRYAH